MVDYSLGGGGTAALQDIIDDFLSRIVALEASGGGGGARHFAIGAGNVDGTIGDPNLGLVDGNGVVITISDTILSVLKFSGISTPEQVDIVDYSVTGGGLVLYAQGGDNLTAFSFLVIW